MNHVCANPQLISLRWEGNDGGSVPLRHSWSGLGNIDQFRWLPRADVLRHLEMARDELGLRHVRACAMFGPETRVAGRKPLRFWDRSNGDFEPERNYQMIDLALEALLDRGLKPVYTTSFTPPGMTSRTTLCWPDKNPVGLPDDLNHWEEFVRSALQHHVRRYGREELRSWYFECWNEPNLSGFFEGTQEEFFRLWSATWRAVKSVDSDFRLGGPSTARAEWIPEFLDWTRRDGTPPDYIVAHVYNNDSESEPLSPFDGPASHRVKDSPHFASGVIRGLKKTLEEKDFVGEIHWNEWGRSWFPHDLRREGGLEAAFIVKTMAEVSQCGDRFAYWCLSDIYDQIGFQSAEFQGHYGMLSLHGLRKPAWLAHQLLCRLGSRQVALKSNDATVTVLAARDGDRTQVLIAAVPELVATASPDTIRIELPMPKLSGIKKPTVIRVTQDENNVIQDWTALGAPAYPTPQQIRELHQINGAPQMVADGDMEIRNETLYFSLARPGIAFVEL